uniref:Replication factor A C-terminal domain-containing protein n=1 Tax=Brassica oleracea var. oleracea TaxID=109376 RepID=A0A0D3AQK0_BRAOL
MAMKRNGKSHVSSDSDEKFMSFKDISLGPHEAQLRFRLIHFWEARNPVKKTLIGLEMLLIDEQGTVIQGFIPPGRINKYLPEMKRGSVYKLINFYGSKNKPVYRVADHVETVSFAWNSEMSVLHEIPISFDEDRFRFHSYKDFEANCDLKGDLHGKHISFRNYFSVTLLYVIGHMKLVNGQTLIERPSLDDVKIATTRHIMIHVQSHDGPVMKFYLWDQTATDFCKKFNSCENTPTVLLVTTVNTKRLGGTLALSSMSSTRVFMDYDVQPTRDYFTWLGSNPEIANQVSTDVITKRETLTIADIFSYMTQESAKCTATIDDVVHGSPWYYIACSECHSKATNDPSSLICTNTKCGKVNTADVPQYRAKISVYDNSEQAFFVILGDAGRELTGRHASKLVSSYFEANKSEGADHEVSVPEALISTIGQTHKFCVKVTDHNFTGNTRAITVTKILPLDTPPPTEASVGNDIGAMSEEAKESGNDVCEPPTGRVDPADEESKRPCSSADPRTAKRSRCEN